MTARLLLPVLASAGLYAGALVAWPLWLRPRLAPEPLESLLASSAWVLLVSSLAALLTTRGLSDPLRLWRRLWPVAATAALALTLALTLGVPPLSIGQAVLGRAAAALMGAVFLYSILWAWARGLRQVGWWGSAEETRTHLPWRKRTGVRLWTALLLLGLLLETIETLWRRG